MTASNYDLFSSLMVTDLPTISGFDGLPILFSPDNKRMVIGKSGKPVVHISFSGGLTSGYMTEWLLANFSDTYEFVVTFANTGLEVEETLEFVRRCDEEKGFNTIWLEAVINPEKGKGTRHKIVTFETATRRPDLFEQMVKKYGIPNKVYKHCTRELKVSVMNSYLRDRYKTSPNYIPTAIGIRNDEAQRMAKDTSEFNLIYPLVTDNPVDKEFVKDYWNKQPFTLGIEEHNGNCMMCFEKADSKLFKQIQEYPGVIEFHIEMEKLYGHISNQPDKPGRVFFRHNRSGAEILALAEQKACETPCSEKKESKGSKSRKSKAKQADPLCGNAIACA